LDKNFKAESLDDFKCESCETVGEIVIHRKLTKLPRILILYFKRYEWVEITPTTIVTKTTTTIETDSSLSLSTVKNNNNNDENPSNSFLDLTTTTTTTASDKIVPPPPPPPPPKTYKLVKNDAEIEIPRELSVHSHIEQSQTTTTTTTFKVEQPKKLSDVELERLKKVATKTKTTTDSCLNLSMGGVGDETSASAAKRRQTNSISSSSSLSDVVSKRPPISNELFKEDKVKKTPLGKVDENSQNGGGDFCSLKAAPKTPKKTVIPSTTSPSTVYDYVTDDLPDFDLDMPHNGKYNNNIKVQVISFTDKFSKDCNGTQKVEI
jgi:hypothetical protein